jgi:uncharacterized protein YraI
MKAKKTSWGVSVYLTISIAVLVLSACGGSETPATTQDLSQVQTQAAQTVVADLTANAPVATQVPPATGEPTQPAPPPGPTLDPNLPLAVIPTPAPGDPAAIADYNTAIYGGPGTDYVMYAAFVGSATAEVVGKNEDASWWAISVPVAPTGSGWVSADWVTVRNVDNVPVLPAPPVPATTNLVPPGPDDPQATALANTYVRSGPAANYPAYGIATAGASGRVLGVSEDGQWWVVRLNPDEVGTGYGWVSINFTQASNVADVPTIQNPDTHGSVPPPTPAAGAPTATAVEYLNVRAGPGTNYPVLGVAAPGASAEVNGMSADGAWWQVLIPTEHAESGFGWVSADYVTTQNADSVPVVAAPPAPPSIGPTPPPSSGGNCLLVSQDPADGTSFNAGSSFNTTWVLQNTGTADWEQANVDVRYVGAADNIQLHQGSDVYDLTTNVQPGSSYNFTVSMLAPSDAGTYGEVWEIAQGSTQICQFYVYIEVP